MTKELETHEIQTMLSRPETAFGLSRRKFLIGALATAGAVVANPYLAGAQTLASASTAKVPGVLVVVQLAGGMDGLNVVVPYGDSAYHAARGSNAIATGTLHVADAREGVGFHPSLTGLARRYAAGQVAVVRGIDYPNPDLSHFTSMLDWMSALPGQDATTGWLGRWLDQVGNPGGLAGIAIGSSIPLHLVGATTQATSIPVDQGSAWGAANLPNPYWSSLYQASERMAAGVNLGPWGDALAGSLATSTAQALRLQPLFSPALPDSSLVSQMTLAARLINAELGIRVIHVVLGSFDTHQGESSTLAGLLSQFDNAVSAFYATLASAKAGKVAIATWSEFGRRVEFNGSAGTDHGTANSHFVIGAQVNGGLVTPQPSLSAAALDANGNLVPSTDFRQYYATLIDQWLGGDSAEVLPGTTPSQRAHIPLFRGPPTGSSTPINGGTKPPVVRPSGAGGYWLVTSSGQVLSYGRPAATTAVGPGAPVVAMASTPDGLGYWLARADGTVLAGGTATHHGDLEGKALNRPIVSMASSSSGRGYWLMGSDGGIFTFGDARFYGSTGGHPLNRPAVTMAAVPSGNGYWVAASDGGIFTFGTAGFHGSAGSLRLNEPIVGMAPTPSGRGYWLVASDGGIFTYGDAKFLGSTGNLALNKPIVGMAPSPTGRGYWLVSADGGIFTFGDAKFMGSAGANPPAAPVLGIVV